MVYCILRSTLERTRVLLMVHLGRVGELGFASGVLPPPLLPNEISFAFTSGRLGFYPGFHLEAKTKTKPNKNQNLAILKVMAIAAP